MRRSKRPKVVHFHSCVLGITLCDMEVPIANAVSVLEPEKATCVTCIKQREFKRLVGKLLLERDKIDGFYFKK